jgi:LL-diaminopimelate aminotransferase
MFEVSQSERLRQLPPYLFKEIDRKKVEVKARGVDIIDLGVGDPDRPTPPHIVAALAETARDRANHQYPSYNGMGHFRESVARWYRQRFEIKLDPDKEIVTLIGSKEGIAHIPLAFIDPGDVALVPEPAYPVYKIGTIFAGGVPYYMPLKEENGFLPDLSAVPEEVARKARLMYINYPNNPTAACAGVDFYRRVVEFAEKYEIIVLSDAAYSEVSLDGYVSRSFLEVEGALEVGLEFHSLSKTYNMTGWRIGWAAGRAEIVRGLGMVKENVDSGAFQAIQFAGIAALEGDQRPVEEMRRMYARRRDVLVAGLRDFGLKITPPKATFYLWVKVPEGYTSAGFTSVLMERTGIICTPGNGFGPSGEGYIRFALCQEEERLQEAVERIRKLKL